MVQATAITTKHLPGCQKALQNIEQVTPSDPL